MQLAGLCCLELAGGKNRKIVLPSPHACRTFHPKKGDGEGESFLQGHVSQRCVLRCCLMGQKSWAILWQRFATCTVRKAVVWFFDSNMQRKTSSLQLSRFLPRFLQRFGLDIRKFFLLRICSMGGCKKQVKKHLSGEYTAGVSAGLWLD